MPCYPGWELRAKETLTNLFPSLGSFMSTAERVRLPDDCTVGYIVEGLLGARLLHSPLFHSHLENLQRLPTDAVLQQVGLAPWHLSRWSAKNLVPCSSGGLDWPACHPGGLTAGHRGRSGSVLGFPCGVWPDPLACQPEGPQEQMPTDFVRASL